MPSQLPNSFLGSSGGGVRVGQGAARVVEVPASATPPPARLGSLSVHADGSVYLDARTARSLPAGDGTIDLRPPVAGDEWHLDCRPGGLCQRRPWGNSGGVRFRALSRVRLLLGYVAGPVSFELQPASNGLFRLCPSGGHKPAA